jgi:hypothetical protein
MILQITPDKEKAKSLKNMALETLERLKEMPIKKYPSNTLKDYYDIIHELMEALTLAEGLKFKGEGAHQELINYISKKYEFSEQKRIFLQQIRDYRNRISYEGFTLNESFLDINEKRIKDIITKLLNKLKI